MVQYLRMVTNRRYWEMPGIEETWLPEGQLPADAVTQLRTTENSMSVYEIEDEEQLERVAAALAKNRGESKARLDYALIDPAFFEQNGVELVRSNGETKDELVNQWHLDAVHLDSIKALALAEYLVYQEKTFRFEVGKIEELLKKFYSP